MRRYLWPRACVWEVTLGCNLQCLHCGSTAGPKTARDDELTTQEGLDFCDQAIQMGLEQMTLSGGEPLMRPDWPQIVRHLIDGNVRVGIITNGLSITEGVKKELRQLREQGYQLTVGISIDGLAPRHEWIRGRPGLYPRAVREMELLLEMGHPVNILTTVHKKNIDDMPALRENIFQWKPTAWQTQIAHAYGRMGGRTDWLLSLEEYTWLVEFWAETKKISKDVRIDPTDCIGYFGEPEKILRPECAWRGCHAGTRGIGLRSNGDVVGCLSLMDDKFIEGNIRERSLYDIWHDPKSFAYNRDYTMEEMSIACQECGHGALCGGGCVAVSDSVTGKAHQGPYCITRAEMERSAMEQRKEKKTVAG